MDFIKECFEDRDGTFTEKLKGVGFTADQAQQFLPEMASGISCFIQNTGTDKIIKILLSDDPSQLLSALNVDVIGKNMSMNSAQVTLGIEAIAPVISQVFSQKSNQLVEAAASLAWTSPGELSSSVKNFLV